MIKALLIDMDGLLIDSEKYSYQVYVDFLKLYNIDFDKQFYATRMAGYKAADNVRTILDYYHIDRDFDEAFNFIVNKEVEYFNAGIPLKKGAKQLLDYLKENNYKIILATSSLVDRAMTALNFNKITDYFDDKVFGSELKRGKPYPDIFLLASKKANCLPSECLVLEDAETGVEAAYNGGIPVICVPDVKQPRQEYRDKCLAVCDDLFEVIDYLKNNNQ